MDPILANTGGPTVSEAPKIGPDENDFYQDRMENIGSESREETQASIRDTLGYAPFVAPNKKGEKSPESEEALKEQAGILKNPLTPFVERLLHDEVITPETYNELTGQFTKNPDYKTVIENSENIDSEKKQIIIDGLDGLNNPEMAEKNKRDFTRDFAEDLEIFKDGERTEEATDMIGAVYILGPNGVDNPMEQSESLDMALKTALNRALEGRVDLPVNNETFQKNLDLVRNIGAENGRSDFETRFEALGAILTVIHNTDGAKNKAILKDRRQINERKAGAELDVAERERIQGEIQQAQTEGDLARIGELRQKLAELETKKEPARGEVFAAGEIDIQNEGEQSSETV